MKEILNNLLSPDTPSVHVGSAAFAGFVTCSCTNPIWLVKTRLQLDKNHLTASQCIRDVWKKEGIRGFYRGVTASYAGISETMVHFVIYEQLKTVVFDEAGLERGSGSFHVFMGCGAVSKLIASTLAYPHELARTRLREEGTKYRGFWQTLGTVFREEGGRGLYRGLSVHLMRQIPNTAVMLATYEVAVDFFRNAAAQHAHQT